MNRKDLPQVLAISRENMARIIFTSWGVEWRDEDLLHILMEPTARTEVLESEGHIVAYYSVDLKGEGLFINSIQVERDHQKQGLGREMMERIEKLAINEQLKVIELWVQITNRSAMEFYRHMGYRMVSRQGNNYLMRKILPVNLSRQRGCS